MQPVIKLNYYVVSITVTIMFLAVPKASVIINTHLTPEFIAEYGGQTGKTSYTILIGALASLAVYKLLLLGLQWTFENIRPLRKRILGPYFVEGTWVGFYGISATPYYAIDVYEQTFTRTTIKGWGYVSKEEQRANWESDMVHIDPSRRSLAFICTVNFFPQLQSDAITEFTFIRKDKNSPPEKNGRQFN